MYSQVVFGALVFGRNISIVILRIEVALNRFRDESDASVRHGEHRSTWMLTRVTEAGCIGVSSDVGPIDFCRAGPEHCATAFHIAGLSGDPPKPTQQQRDRSHQQGPFA